MWIFYKKPDDDRTHKKIIYFGLKGVPNKIDGVKVITKKKDRTDLFHPYFWENIFLNNK